jgi:hypothetical protein
MAIFAAIFLFDADKTLILKEIKSWIDHTRTRAVVALGQVFYLFNQFVAVAGVAGEDVEDHQTQFAMAEETLTASAAAATPATVFAMFAAFAVFTVVATWPSTFFMMMSHSLLLYVLIYLIYI